MQDIEITKGYVPGYNNPLGEGLLRGNWLRAHCTLVLTSLYVPCRS